MTKSRPTSAPFGAHHRSQASAAWNRRYRLLFGARLVSTAAVAIVAPVAVDMPDGYLGGRDQFTTFGVGYTAAMVLMALVALAGLWRRSAWWPGLAALLPAVQVGVFVPALLDDPIVAGAVVAWSLVRLAQRLFPLPSGFQRRLWIEEAEPVPAPRYAPGASRSRHLFALLRDYLAGGAGTHRVWGPALRHIAIASLFLSIGVVGFRLSGLLLARGVCLTLGYAVIVASWPLMRDLRAQGSRLALLAPWPMLASVLAFASSSLMLVLLSLGEILLVMAIVGAHENTEEVVRSFYEHPSRLIVATFAGAILVGTMLLTFPASAPPGERIAPLDALFTATSATCVTGLIVLDTPNDLSAFGQGVVLALIQVGGLGIMVLSTFAALLLGGRLGLRGERALSEMLDLQTGAVAYRLIRFIVAVTLAIEAAGAVALGLCFAANGLSLGEAAWRGTFHAVSAFCNAGFALQSDSLEMFRGQPAPLLIFLTLIVSGGLGFVVLAALGSLAMRRRSQPMTVQVRLVLVATTVLLFGGTLFYLVLEWNRSLVGLSVSNKVVNALFQSATLRTAGFNSVDLGSLAPATVVMMLLFMFVGASPGSTGGGIKTTTVAVLLASVRASVSGREAVTLFHRRVPVEIVLRSVAIIVVSVGIVALGTLSLVVVMDTTLDGVLYPTGSPNEIPFEHLLFEAVSAFGTVGLSLGATTQLGPVGKLMIIVIMFVGRIGPLTLALMIGAGKGVAVKVRQPETRLMVG